jgi:Flp pilus assembly protein TadG
LSHRSSLFVGVAKPNHQAGEYFKMMKRFFSRFFRHSKGQMMVLYAGIVAVLLGATALCTDVAVMYVNSIQLQKGADSAAIAGATYLTGLAFSGAAAGCTTAAGFSDDAQIAACTYASNNGIAVDANLTITEPTASTLKVAAQRTNLPYYFGKVIGLSTYSVSATSTGQAAEAVGTVRDGMFPVGLQCTSPCTLSNMDPGQSVSFGKKFVGGLAPGNWQWLDLANGDAGLGNAIVNGAPASYKIGVTIGSEPGNKGNSNPVITNLATRLSQCHPIADPCTAAGGNPKTIPVGDKCLVIVPAVDYKGCNGNCTMTIEGFALIYLEPHNTTGTSINGCFVQAVAPDTLTSLTAPQLGADMPPILIN